MRVVRVIGAVKGGGEGAGGRSGQATVSQQELLLAVLDFDNEARFSETAPQGASDYSL